MQDEQRGLSHSDARVKILVAYHKPYQLLQSDVFVPIHVGRSVALEPAKDGLLDSSDRQWLLDRMIGDDTGVNISSRNRNYCELTGMYWAWQNYQELGNPDYVGCMQYRRHFIFDEGVYDNYQHHNDDERAYAKINVGYMHEGYLERFGLTDGAVIAKCQEYDCIIPVNCELEHVGISSIREDYTACIEGTKARDLKKLQRAVAKVAPEYAPVLAERLNASDKRCFHSFVMRRELFFDYCEFLFGVLEEVDKHLDTSRYSLNGQRTLGYLGELLFDCYTHRMLSDNKVRVKELGMTFLCADSIPEPIQPKTAIVLLAHSDYESLELSLAAHGRFMPENVKLFILQNGRGSYDCERTYRVAKRYEAIYPRSIEVVDDIPEQVAYFAILELLSSQRLRDYEYIVKVDDDCFPITEDWFDRLCSLYEQSFAYYGNNIAYATVLVNNNPFGFKQLIERVDDLSSEYFDTIAREHLIGKTGVTEGYAPARIISATEIGDGAHGTIWRYSYIARWLHERTSLMPDWYIQAVRGLPDIMLGDRRYSINCMLFKKSFWSDIWDADCEFPDDDEYMSEQYCKRNGKLIPVRLSIPFIHMFFFSQREENRDMASAFRAVYQEWLGLPFPIAIQTDKLLENENRLRFIEATYLNKPEKRPLSNVAERLRANKPIRALWRKLPMKLRRIISDILRI